MIFIVTYLACVGTIGVVLLILSIPVHYSEKKYERENPPPADLSFHKEGSSLCSNLIGMGISLIVATLACSLVIFLV